MSQLHRTTLAACLLVLGMTACGDPSIPDGISAEGREALERMRDGVEKGLYVGWESGLVALRERGEAAHAVPVLLELIRRSDDLGASQALSLVETLGPQGRAIAGPLAREAAVDHGFFWKPADVADAIGHVRPDPADLVAPVRELLQSEKQEVRDAGAEIAALAGPGGAELVPDLLRAFDRGETSSRKLASALASIGTPEAGAGLKARLDAKDGGADALGALVALGEDAASAYEAVLARLANEALAEKAAAYVAGFPDRASASIPALLDAIEAVDDVYARWRLLDALGEIVTPGHAEVRDRLLALLRPGAPGAEDVARALARAAPDDTDVHAAILRGVRTEGIERRTEWIEALGAMNVAAEATQAALEAALSETDVEISVAAIRAMPLAASAGKAARMKIGMWSRSTSRPRLAAAALLFFARRGELDDGGVPLASALDEWSSRSIAEEALRAAGRAGPEAREVLLRYLSPEQRNRNARAAALVADLGIQDPAFLEALEAGRSAPYLPFRLPFARALHRLRGEEAAARATAIGMLETLHAFSKARETAALCLLEEHGASEEARGALRRAARDPNPAIRRIARRADEER